MLSALLPATYTSAFLRSGSVSFRFFSSTCDLATARRATARCAFEPMSSMFLRSVNGCSKSPSSNFLVRIRLTASLTRLIGTRPACTSAMSVASKLCAEKGSMNMSMPAFAPVRTWVAPVAGDLMDALPVTDDEPLEVHRALEDAGDQLTVCVHLDRVPDAVLGPVDARERRHDRSRRRASARPAGTGAASSSRTTGDP